MPQGEPREELSLNYNYGLGYWWSDLCKPANLVKQFFQDCFTNNAQ